MARSCQWSEIRRSFKAHPKLVVATTYREGGISVKSTDEASVLTTIVEIDIQHMHCHTRNTPRSRLCMPQLYRSLDRYTTDASILHCSGLPSLVLVLYSPTQRHLLSSRHPRQQSSPILLTDLFQRLLVSRQPTHRQQSPLECSKISSIPSLRLEQ